MTQTTNYNLNKFEGTDTLNPTTLNGLNANADTIDSALASKPTATLVTSISASSTDAQVPSAKCVFDNLGTGSGFADITSPVTIWSTDLGTYHVPTGCTIYYNGTSTAEAIVTTTDGYLFIYKNTGSDKKYWVLIHAHATSVGGNEDDRWITSGYTTSSSGTYSRLTIGNQDYTSLLNKPTIATSITSSSTNSEIAGAKAVYDNALKTADITNSISYTAEAGVTVSTFEVYKTGSLVTLHVACSYASTSGVKQLMTISNLLPLVKSYGGGTVYGTGGAKITLGRIDVDGIVSTLGIGTTHEQTDFAIVFVPNN